MRLFLPVLMSCWGHWYQLQALKILVPAEGLELSTYRLQGVPHQVPELSVVLIISGFSLVFIHILP